MTDRLEELLHRIEAAASTQPTVLVGIDGPGAAGKTTVTAALAEALVDLGRVAAVVHVDDFYLPSAERPAGPPETKPIGGDFDWRRLRDEVLLPLRNHRLARYARYDWKRDALAERQEVSPDGIVIVEGVTCTRRELAELYDIRVWVACPRALRLARGLARDGEAARDRWEGDWMPGEDRYVREHRPEEGAHVVIDGSGA